ncbi:hypothetical protein PIB30_066601 [Stylosanthes scabra]|uniref:Uncharacterized protein n=1 Tax=Stylosanthes scabra TaxID=79078 RepID=A0ABU6YMN8_9FABA|nr:hypothetical protein [Stylosanthes scabra]
MQSTIGRRTFPRVDIEFFDDVEIESYRVLLQGEGSGTAAASAHATDDALVLESRGVPDVMFSVASAAPDVMDQVAREFRQSWQFPSAFPDPPITQSMADYPPASHSGGVGTSQWGQYQTPVP